MSSLFCLFTPSSPSPQLLFLLCKSITFWRLFVLQVRPNCTVLLTVTLFISVLHFFGGIFIFAFVFSLLPSASPFMLHLLIISFIYLSFSSFV